MIEMATNSSKWAAAETNWSLVNGIVSEAKSQTNGVTAFASIGIDVNNLNAASIQEIIDHVIHAEVDGVKINEGKTAAQIVTAVIAEWQKAQDAVKVVSDLNTLYAQMQSAGVTNIFAILFPNIAGLLSDGNLTMAEFKSVMSQKKFAANGVALPYAQQPAIVQDMERMIEMATNSSKWAAAETNWSLVNGIVSEAKSQTNGVKAFAELGIDINNLNAATIQEIIDHVIHAEVNGVKINEGKTAKEIVTAVIAEWQKTQDAVKAVAGLNTLYNNIKKAGMLEIFGTLFPKIASLFSDGNLTMAEFKSVMGQKKYTANGVALPYAQQPEIVQDMERMLEISANPDKWRALQSAYNRINDFLAKMSKYGTNSTMRRMMVEAFGLSLPSKASSLSRDAFTKLADFLGNQTVNSKIATFQHLAEIHEALTPYARKIRGFNGVFTKSYIDALIKLGYNESGAVKIESINMWQDFVNALKDMLNKIVEFFGKKYTLIEMLKVYSTEAQIIETRYENGHMVKDLTTGSVEEEKYIQSLADSLLYSNTGLRNKYKDYFDEEGNLAEVNGNLKVINGKNIYEAMEEELTNNITSMFGLVTKDVAGKRVLDAEFIEIVNQYIAANNAAVRANTDSLTGKIDEASLIRVQTADGKYVEQITSEDLLNSQELALLSYFIYKEDGNFQDGLIEDIQQYKDLLRENLVAQTYAIKNNVGVNIQRLDSMLSDARTKLPLGSYQSIEIIERSTTYATTTENIMPDWIKLKIADESSLPKYYFIKTIEVIDGIYYESMYTESGELISKIAVRKYTNDRGETVYSKTFYVGSENNAENFVGYEEFTEVTEDIFKTIWVPAKLKLQMDDYSNAFDVKDTSVIDNEVSFVYEQEGTEVLIDSTNIEDIILHGLKMDNYMIPGMLISQSHNLDAETAVNIGKVKFADGKILNAYLVINNGKLSVVARAKDDEGVVTEEHIIATFDLDVKGGYGYLISEPVTKQVSVDNVNHNIEVINVIEYNKKLSTDPKFQIYIDADGKSSFTYNGIDVKNVYTDYQWIKNAEARIFNGGRISPSLVFMPEFINFNGKKVRLSELARDVEQGNKDKYDSALIDVYNQMGVEQIGDKWYSDNIEIISVVNGEGMIVVKHSNTGYNGITYNNGKIFRGRRVIDTVTGEVYYETTKDNIIKTFTGMAYGAVAKNEFKISEYEQLIARAISEYSFGSDFAKDLVDENGVSIFDQNGKIKPDKIYVLLNSLTYVKESILDANGKDIITGWNIYYPGVEQPVAKITSEGFIDFSLKNGDLNAGVRYSMIDLTATPVNLVAITDNMVLVTDLYNRSVSIEERDGTAENTLVTRYYLFPNNLSAFSQQELFDAIRASNPKTVNDIVNLEINGAKAYTLNRVEIFEHYDTLHKFLEVPSKTTTRVIVGSIDTSADLKEAGTIISESTLDSLDLEEGMVEYTVRIFDESINFNKTIKIFRNLQGRTLATYTLDNETGEPTTADFYFNYNEFGVASRSVSLVRVGDQWAVLRESNYQDRIITRSYNNDSQVEAALFSFITTEYADTELVSGLSDTNLRGNIDLLETMTFEDRMFKQKNVIANDGYGRRIMSLTGSALDSNGILSGEPRFVTFSLYNSQKQESYLNVSELLGYATTAVTFVYDSDLGYDMANYFTVNKDGTINVKNGAVKVESADDFRINMENSTLEYQTSSTRWNTRSIREASYNSNGTLNYQIFEGSPFKGKIFKGQIITNQTRLVYNELGLPEATYLILDNGEEVLYQRHYVVFIQDKPGCYFIYSKTNPEGNQDLEGILEKVDESVDGVQIDPSIDTDGDGIIVVETMQDAINLAERSGMYFENGIHKYEVKSKFAPVVWVDYEFRGFLGSALEYVKVLITYHSGNTLLANIFNTHNRTNLTATFGLISAFILLFTYALPITLYAVTMLLSKSFKPKKVKKYKNRRPGSPGDLGFVREESAIDKKGDLELIAEQQRVQVTEKQAKEKLKKLQARIKVNLAVSNKHLRLKGEYNAYLLGLYSENPQVLIDRYMPEGHPLRQQTLDAYNKINKNNSEQVVDFIDEYIVRNIAFLIFTLMIDQATKWGDDMKGAGKVRDVKNPSDYTFSDIDLDNVFRYYLIDLTAEQERLNADKSLSEKERAEQLKQFVNENDPVIKFKLNEHFSELIKNGKLAGTKTIVQDGVNITIDYIEVILNPMREWLAARYKKEGLEQPRYPMDTPIFNVATATIWGLVGVVVFAGILSVLVPALPFFAFVAIGAILSFTFVGSKFMSLEAEKASKRIDSLKENPKDTFEDILKKIESIKDETLKKSELNKVMRDSKIIKISGFLSSFAKFAGAAAVLAMILPLSSIPVIVIAIGLILGAVYFADKYIPATNKDGSVSKLKDFTSIISKFAPYIAIGAIVVAIATGVFAGPAILSALIASALAFAWYFLGSWVLKLGPFAKFQTSTLPKMVGDIIKSAKNYKGNVDPDILKENKKTMRVFFTIFAGMASIIITLTVVFAILSMPLIAWVIAAPILILTFRLLISTAWRFTMGAKGASVHKRDNYDTITKVSQIGKKQLDIIRNNDYLKGGVIEALIKSTLLAGYMVTKKQGELLIKAIENNEVENIAKFLEENGEKLSEQAETEIIKFFNSIEIVLKESGNAEGLAYKIDNMSLTEKDLLSIIVKGTGKKRIKPTVDFLDGVDLDGVAIDENHPTLKGLIKSGFRTMKEMYPDSWRIYMHEALADFGFDEEAIENIITENNLLDINTTLRESIDRIAKVTGQKPSVIEAKLLDQWVIYKSDGYLKTLLYAEKAAETSLRVFLRYKLGREKDENGNLKYTGVKLDAKVEEELQSLLMFVHVHEDIKPNEAKGYGGKDADVIVLELAKRSYILNDINSVDKLVEISRELLREFISDKLNDGRMSQEQLDVKVKNEVEELFASPDSLIDSMINKGYLTGTQKDEEFLRKFFGLSKTIMSTLGDTQRGKADGYPVAVAAKYTVKTDKWSITIQMMEQWLAQHNKEDAMVVNLDRDHFFYPTDFFFMPLLSNSFASDPKMGWALAQLDMKTAGVSMVAAAHSVAEDVWNDIILSAQQESLRTIRLGEIEREFASRNISTKDINLMAIILPAITNTINGEVYFANRLHNWTARELVDDYLANQADPSRKQSIDALRTTLCEAFIKMGIDPIIVDIEGLLFPDQGNKVKTDRTTWTAEQLLTEYLGDPKKYMAKSRDEIVGSFAFYGPGFMRFSVLKEWGAYMSNIEDTAAAIEALKRGYHGGYAAYIINGRPREMLMGSILDFQARFGGLVVDFMKSVAFQQYLKSDQVHWTQKATMLMNFSFYPDKPLAMLYNLMIFIGALMLSFNPFVSLPFVGVFIVVGLLSSQAITSGSILKFVQKYGFWKGVKEFAKVEWALISTFVPIIPQHVDKVLSAFKGAAGVFSSGVKDIIYPKLKFEVLYAKYKSTIQLGTAFLVLILLSPFSPFGFIGQFFIYIMAVVFLVGPFTYNAPYVKAERNIVIAAMALFVLQFVALVAFGPATIVFGISVGLLTQFTSYATLALLAGALGIVSKKTAKKIAEEIKTAQKALEEAKKTGTPEDIKIAETALKKAQNQARGTAYLSAMRDGVKAVLWPLINPNIKSSLDKGIQWLSERNSNKDKVKNADAILLLGTKYPKVAIGAAEAYKNNRRPIFILAGVGRETGTLYDMKKGKNTRLDKKADKEQYALYVKLVGEIKKDENGQEKIIDGTIDTRLDNLAELFAKDPAKFWDTLETVYGISRDKKIEKEQAVARKILALKAAGKTADEIFKEIEKETVAKGDEEKTWTQFYFRNGALTDANLEAIASGKETVVEIVIAKLLDRKTRNKILIPEAFLYYEILVAMGVPEEDIKVDAQSTTTVENMIYGVDLMQQYIEKNPGSQLRNLLVMQEPYLQRRARLTVAQQLPEKWEQKTGQVWTGEIISYAPYAYQKGYAESGTDKYNNELTNEMRKNFVSEIDKLMTRPFDGNLAGEHISFDIINSAEKMRFLNKYNIDAESGLLKLSFYMIAKLWIDVVSLIKWFIFNIRITSYSKKPGVGGTEEGPISPVDKPSPTDSGDGTPLADQQKSETDTAQKQAEAAAAAKANAKELADNKYSELRTKRIKAIETLLNNGMNEQALKAIAEFENTEEYRNLQSAIDKAFKDGYSFDKKQIANLEKYRNFRQVIEKSIKDQNINMEIIADPVFIDEIIKWINDFKSLKTILNQNPEKAKEMGFVMKNGEVVDFDNRQETERIIRAMAKEVNRRLASRDGYLQFIKDESSDPDGYDRYCRVKEGVVQVLVSDLYDAVIINDWVYAGSIEEQVNRTAHELAYYFLRGVVSAIVAKKDKIDPIKLPELYKIVEKMEDTLKDTRFVDYKKEEDGENRFELRKHTLELSQVLSALINEFVNVAGEQGINIVGKLNKKVLIYSGAPGTGKGELAKPIIEEAEGVIGRLLDSKAKAKILHGGRITLRPNEKQGVPYFFFKKGQLRELERKQGDIFKLVLVNGQEQAVIRGEKGDVPIYEIGPDRKVTDKLASDQSIGKGAKGLGAMYATSKLAALEGGLGIALAAKEYYPDGSFIFISPFTESQIADRGNNENWISQTFIGGEELRLANECLQEMIIENKGEVNLEENNNLSKLISKVEELLGRKIKINEEQLIKQKSEETPKVEKKVDVLDETLEKLIQEFNNSEHGIAISIHSKKYSLSMVDALSKRLKAVVLLDGNYIMPDDNGVERTGAFIIAKSDDDLKAMQEQNLQRVAASVEESKSASTGEVVKQASEEAVNASQNTVNASGTVQKIVIDNISYTYTEKDQKIKFAFDTTADAYAANYKKIASVPIPLVGRTDKKGRQLSIKFNIMVLRQADGSISVNLQVLGTSKKIFDSLSIDEQKDLLETAKAMLMIRLDEDKYVSDKFLRTMFRKPEQRNLEKISNDTLDAVNLFEKEIRQKADKARNELKKKYEEKYEKQYGEKEVKQLIEQLLGVNPAAGVIPVGIKETELKITPKLDIARRLDVEKRAGTTTIVLKGQYSVDTVQFIRARGFEVIIVQEVNGKENIDLSQYAGLKELSGVRFEITEKGAEKMIGDIISSFGHISISYDFNANIITEESVEFVKNQNATLVIDARVIADKPDIVSAINKAKLAENAQVVLRIESDNDDNSIALMGDAIKLLGMQGQKLSINIKKTFIDNRDKLMNVFKTDPASEYRSKGSDESFEDIFGNLKAEIIAKELASVISGDMKYEEFGRTFNTKFGTLFADKSEIEDIMKMTEKPGYYNDYIDKDTKETITLEKVKMILIRQYILGIFISHIGKEIIPQIAEDMPLDMNKMKLNARQIIVYEIMQLLMDGESVADIKSYEFNPDQSKTLFDMVNNIMARNEIKDILRAWNMTDMAIDPLEGSKVIEKIEDIHTLIFDSINVDNIGDKIAIVTLDGIKATLSAA
ncbi:MAG: ElyC/SanA/YdcF family protein [Endomicrobiaceae bacterium]|nr:ElyC/SanA/YdcF family protein [Endomicrobiaceae bacterium]